MRDSAHLTLVLGGARSGKSSYAQRLAEGLGGTRTYVATAEPLDDEMAERIARHRADRGTGWQTLEAPLDVAGALQTAAGDVVLVDCLTLWLSNLMHHQRNITTETDVLLAATMASALPVIFVSNEVGLSVVPENALARRFRDLQGRLNQQVAAAADRVDFVAAGLPLRLK